ncbi:MAG: DNA cytosine methyltransferase, partial [Alphaproteobacteria bacterium]
RRCLKLVDLFAGCGGISLGVEEAARQRGQRLDVRLVSEIDDRAATAYRANLNLDSARMRGDVTELFGRGRGEPSELEARTRRAVGNKVDMLVGGPPCQGHSTLNNHTRGDDPKNALYLVMARAAEVLQPTSVLIENVPAVERDANGVVDRARRRLEEAGYWVDTAIVDMHKIGVPQTRKRHVLLASRRGKPNVREAVADALCPGRDIAWAFTRMQPPDDSLFRGAAKLSPRNLERVTVMMSRKLHDLPAMLRPACQAGFHKYKSMYGRLRFDQPAQTITTGFGSPGQGRYFHPDQPRALTAHEAARLQFFPDWFDFECMPHRTAFATAIGNAVPPKLGFVLARHLLDL